MAELRALPSPKADPSNLIFLWALAGGQILQHAAHEGSGLRVRGGRGGAHKTPNPGLHLSFAILGQRVCKAASLPRPSETREVTSSRIISAFSPSAAKKKFCKRKKKKNEREHMRAFLMSVKTQYLQEQSKRWVSPAEKRSGQVGAGGDERWGPAGSFPGPDVYLRQSTAIQTNQSLTGFRNAKPAHSVFLVPPKHCLCVKNICMENKTINKKAGAVLTLWVYFWSPANRGAGGEHAFLFFFFFIFVDLLFYTVVKSHNIKLATVTIF